MSGASPEQRAERVWQRYLETPLRIGFEAREQVAAICASEIRDAERAAREEGAAEEAWALADRIQEYIKTGAYNSTIVAVLASWSAWIRARHAKKPEPVTFDPLTTKIVELERAARGCSVSSVSGNTFIGPDEARVRELIREGIEADHILCDLGRDVRIRKIVAEELGPRVEKIADALLQQAQLILKLGKRP